MEAESNEQEVQNTIIATNIKWHKPNSLSHIMQSSSKLPEEFTLGIPSHLLPIKDNKQKYQQFKDEIEQFVYNFLTKKFDTQCTFCQIWLPL